MADSGKKTQVENTPESTALVVIPVSKGEGTREVMRAASGQFAKKPKPLIPTIEFTRAERKKLNSVRSDKDGLTEYMVAFMNLVRIAQNTDSDPKAMMAAVKAFEVIRTSALGKPATAEQDLDRITTQPVKTIVVVAPQLMHPEIQEEKRGDTKTQPSFAEIVSVETNKK